MFRLSRTILLGCAACWWCAAAGNAPDASLGQANAVMAGLPLRFEANQGQMNSSIRYAAHADGYRLLLGARGATIAHGPRHIGVELVGGNAAPRIEPLDRRATRTDSYVGSRDNWRTWIPTYSRIRYDAVYPGIDIVYYGSQSRLEYDFVLAPGADPAAIRMRFRGAGRVRVNADGDLAIESAAGEIVQKMPAVYQQDAGGVRRRVAARYRLLGRNTVGFRLDAYDRRRELVIDPVLTYCTYFGGAGQDQITAVKYSNGHLYLTGRTDNSDQPPTNGAWSNNIQGAVNIFIAVVDTTHPANGFPVTYFGYIGGSVLDIPNAMDVDANGVVYLTGTTISPDFPLAGNSFQTTFSQEFTPTFVLALNPQLYGGVSLLYSSFLSGTTGNDTGNGIAVDSKGLIYVIGTAQSSDFPVTGNAYQQVLWGPQDSFICQIDPNSGTLLYSTYLGGEADDDGRAILVGSNGLVYFAVSTFSTEFPMAGAQYTTISAGGSDLIFGILDMTQSGNGSLVYSTYYGGAGNDEVRGMSFFGNGEVALTGYTLSSNLPLTLDAVQATYAGNGDAFVVVFDPNLPYTAGLVYSTYFGGTAGEVGYGIASDAAGYLYVTGYTLSKNLPITGSPVQSTWGNGTDIFLAKIHPGTGGTPGLQFSTYLGAGNTYVPCGVQVGPDGTIYIAGYGGIGLPTSSNASQNGYAGGQADGFIAVLSQTASEFKASGSIRSDRVNHRPVPQR